MSNKNARSRPWPQSRRGKMNRDPVTGLGVCWVCDRLINAVVTDAGFATHPDCDPDEHSLTWPPSTAGDVRSLPHAARR